MALFAAAWLALFVQLAQGDDPALSSSSRAAAVQAAPESQPAAAPQVLVDPQTGQTVDPQTGQAVDPQTGQPLDPQQQGASGVAVAPNVASPAPLRSRQS